MMDYQEYCFNLKLRVATLAAQMDAAATELRRAMVTAASLSQIQASLVMKSVKHALFVMAQAWPLAPNVDDILQRINKRR